MPREKHPRLTPEQDRQQRGDSPPGAIGASTPLPSGELDPNWQPSGTGAEAAGWIKEHGGTAPGHDGHRPRQEDVYPYLLIRGHSPGDRGARPLWPPVACWESPVLMLIDATYTGPFSLAQLVTNPVAGRRYRVFIRIWNLGLLPAIGVHVRAWAVNPGFFGGDPNNPAYQPVLIGGAMVNLEDRTRPGAMQVVELDRTWDIPLTLTGHECLMASVTCPLDPWGGALDANNDRHVGQRNLTILAGPAPAKELIWTLGSMVTKSGTLEILHGGAAVTPLLQGLIGRTKTEWSTRNRRAPAAKALRLGVPTGQGQHLATMFATGDGWLVADSAKVWAMALELGMVERDRKVARPLATPGMTRALLEKMGPDRAARLGVTLRGEAGDALLEGLVRLWGIDRLRGADLARAMGGEAPEAHLLRFAFQDPETRTSGGYSVIAIGA